MTDDLAPLPDRISTSDGETLEATWSTADDPRAVAVLTHPHPLYGGDMHNIVPAALARSLPGHGIATLRFNFRSVGASTGQHGGGDDEIADVVAAIDAATTTFPGLPVIGVGYSFGADVMLATGDGRLAAVVAVAPPLAVLPAAQLEATRGAFSTLVLSPEHDQFRPAADAVAVTADWPDTSVVEIPGADHFLAGATSFVADQVLGLVAAVIRPG
ncbi:alpha/beta hydrolase [Actinospongicola halichondriae]|uniref:alpha/beta hydrolase n=1 Tax=Actinospongicola halichondriae TaxID=3236844 RepID=UPI003D4A3D07